MRSKRIEEIFEECLERVFDGESIEESVSRYPEQAKELRELLETAVATRESSRGGTTPGISRQGASAVTKCAA